VLNGKMAIKTKLAFDTWIRHEGRYTIGFVRIWRDISLVHWNSSPYFRPVVTFRWQTDSEATHWYGMSIEPSESSTRQEWKDATAVVYRVMPKEENSTPTPIELCNRLEDIATEVVNDGRTNGLTPISTYLDFPPNEYPGWMVDKDKVEGSVRHWETVIARTEEQAKDLITKVFANNNMDELERFIMSSRPVRRVKETPGWSKPESKRWQDNFAPQPTAETA